MVSQTQQTWTFFPFLGGILLIHWNRQHVARVQDERRTQEIASALDPIKPPDEETV